MYSNWSNILSHTALFKNIDQKSIDSLLNCIKPHIHEFKKGEYIAISDDFFQGIGIILSGEAIVVKENLAGNRIRVKTLRKGDIFGEMVAFSKRKSWPVSVQAESDVIAIFLPPKKIARPCGNVCISHQDLILNMLQLVSNRGLLLNKRIEYLSLRSVREKICTYLLEQYQKHQKLKFKLPMNRNELAEYLNVTRPSLSREMCNMRDEGLIDFSRSSIELLDIEKIKSALY